MTCKNGHHYFQDPIFPMHRPNEIFRLSIIVPKSGQTFRVNLDGLEQVQWPVLTLLELYKNQSGIEQNFRFLKDPVIVNSIFLKKPSRIEVLGLVKLGTVNESAAQVQVDAVIHAGNFGFYDEDSFERLSDRELRLHVVHADLPRAEVLILIY